MHMITSGQYWGMFFMLLVIGALMVFAFLWHWRKVDQDTLRQDRKELVDWAHRYADERAKELADEMFLQYVSNMKIKPVLVNQSDMDWGDKN